VCFCLNITLKIQKHCSLCKVVDCEPTPSMYMFCLQLLLPVTYPRFHKCHFQLVLQKVFIPVRLLCWQLTLSSPGMFLSLKVRGSI